MNKVILMGRLTKDPDIKYSTGANSTCVARYSLAVDRKYRQNDGDPSADFINVVAFGKAGEFAEKYLHKGTKVLVTGRIQTGSYTNKDGQKVYTTDVIAEEQEFAESKNANGASNNSEIPNNASNDGFNMSFGNVSDEDLPFAPPTR